MSPPIIFNLWDCLWNCSRAVLPLTACIFDLVIPTLPEGLLEGKNNTINPLILKRKPRKKAQHLAILSETQAWTLKKNYNLYTKKKLKRKDCKGRAGLQHHSSSSTGTRQDAVAVLGADPLDSAALTAAESCFYGDKRMGPALLPSTNADKSQPSSTGN